jgi:hypothetical protein
VCARVCEHYGSRKKKKTELTFCLLMKLLLPLADLSDAGLGVLGIHHTKAGYFLREKHNDAGPGQPGIFPWGPVAELENYRGGCDLTV